MPDPVLYSQAMILSAVISFSCVLVTGGRFRSADSVRGNLAGLLGFALGLVAGYWALHLRVAWPPRNGLDRLLTIVLPLAFVMELAAARSPAAGWVVWGRRLFLGLVAGRILLHGSVYLGSVAHAWTPFQTFRVLAISGGGLVVVWWLLEALSERTPGVTIPLSVALAIQCAGVTVMLAGYVTGGAAALPLVAAIAGATIASRLTISDAHLPGLIGIPVVGLFGLLFVGRFFGGLSTLAAVTIFLAPLLSWGAEIPAVRGRRPWIVGTLRLLLVAIPLVAVLWLAKQHFDRDTAPLLGSLRATLNPLSGHSS